MVTYINPIHGDNARAGTVSGLGGLEYYSPWQLDKKYYGTGNSAAQQYHKAAGQILQGAESADAAMLRAYRDQYRARLGNAAQAQGENQRGVASSAAASGLTGDSLRRALAGGEAQQASRLSALQGDLQGSYGLQKAALQQGTGNALAGLLVDETKFGKSYGNTRRADSTGALAAAGTALATIVGTVIGGPGGGAAGNMLGQAVGKQVTPQPLAPQPQQQGGWQMGRNPFSGMSMPYRPGPQSTYADDPYSTNW